MQQLKPAGELLQYTIVPWQMVSVQVFRIVQLLASGAGDGNEVLFLTSAAGAGSAKDGDD